MFQVWVSVFSLYFSVQVVEAGTSKSYHEESGSVVAEVHHTLLHPSNVQVLSEVN